VTILLFVLIFGVVVLSHEFGHFIIARANGIHVVEFSIGMGPRLFSVGKKTKYSVKLFPIGGACMFEGEDGLNKEEGQPLSSGAFPNANVWARIATVVAGPFFNFILAYLIALIIVNMAPSWEPVATTVMEDGAAYEAGLRDGDRITGIGNNKIYLYDEIMLYSQTNQGKETVIRYERDGEDYAAKITPKWDDESERYMLGISYQAQYADTSGFNMFRYAWYEMRYSAVATYKSLGMLLTGRVGREDVAGPVGIAVNVVGETYEVAKSYGWESVVASMLNITLLLSVNLGILNLLPLPALDGGRLVFLFLEVIRKKPIPPEKEGIVHFIGLVFFMGLMIFLLFNDIRNIFIR
jgi:regulator of sigma E protease